jgi:hypothetical protein
MQKIYDAHTHYTFVVVLLTELHVFKHYINDYYTYRNQPTPGIELWTPCNLTVLAIMLYH